MWLLFLFFLLQLIQCSVNPIKQILSPPKKQQFSSWIYANKILKAYFTKACVIKPPCDYTRSHEAPNWKRAWMFARICFWNDLLCSSYLPAPLEVRMCEFGFGKLQQSRCDHGTFHPGIGVPHRTVFFTLRRVRRPVGQADGILYREK